MGLSCLGGAVFLQILVFTHILFQDYFLAVETNMFVLTFEVALTVLAFGYFVYIYRLIWRKVRYG